MRFDTEGVHRRKRIRVISTGGRRRRMPGWCLTGCRQKQRMPGWCLTGCRQKQRMTGGCLTGSDVQESVVQVQINAARPLVTTRAAGFIRNIGKNTLAILLDKEQFRQRFLLFYERRQIRPARHKIPSDLCLSLPEIVLVAVFVSCDELLAFCKCKCSFRSIARLEFFHLDAFCSFDRDR